MDTAIHRGNQALVQNEDSEVIQAGTALDSYLDDSPHDFVIDGAKLRCKARGLSIAVCTSILERICSVGIVRALEVAFRSPVSATAK